MMYIYIFNAQQCQACTAGSTGSDSHPRTTISRFFVGFFAFRPGERKAKRLDPNDMSI